MSFHRPLGTMTLTAGGWACCHWESRLLPLALQAPAIALLLKMWIGRRHMLPGEQNGSHFTRRDPQNCCTLLCFEKTVSAHFSRQLPRLPRIHCTQMRFLFLSLTYLGLSPACTAACMAERGHWYLSNSWVKGSRDSFSMTNEGKGSCKGSWSLTHRIVPFPGISGGKLSL